MGQTKLKYEDGTYTFTTQSSTTFIFRIPDGTGGYIDYNPIDYVPQFSNMRGSMEKTVAGSAVIQQFVQTDSDRVITFSMYLTLAETVDLTLAFANRGRFRFTDFWGNIYLVVLDPQAGFMVDHRVKANDKIYCKFTFIVTEKVS
jgi:hypothetical protein